MKGFNSVWLKDNVFKCVKYCKYVTFNQMNLTLSPTFESLIHHTHVIVKTKSI